MTNIRGILAKNGPAGPAEILGLNGPARPSPLKFAGQISQAWDLQPCSRVPSDSVQVKLYFQLAIKTFTIINLPEAEIMKKIRLPHNFVLTKN